VHAVPYKNRRNPRDIAAAPAGSVAFFFFTIQAAASLGHRRALISVPL
jgi:hypothetical protein